MNCEIYNESSYFCKATLNPAAILDNKVEVSDFEIFESHVDSPNDSDLKSDSDLVIGTFDRLRRNRHNLSFTDSYVLSTNTWL